MKAKNILLAIFLTLIILDISFAIYSVFKYTNPSNLSLNTLFYSSGKLAGLIGFLFLSILIFSGETARFFDKFFGINKIILFQRKFALITSLFVILHPILFILSSKSILPYIIPNFTALPLTLGIISLYFFIIIALSSALYKRISYKIWQYIHILTYLLFFFSLYHATNLGSDSGFFPIKASYIIILILIILGIFYRTYYKIKQRFSEKFYLKEIKKETEDTFTLILETKRNFSFKAGQFCFLRLNRKGINARHPISISGSPDEKDLRFTIKLKGRFTKEALNLKVGEEVNVEGPFGIFTIEDAIRKNNNNLVFIAGGVGITPFFSMIKSNLHSNIKKDILLFYCSRTIKGTIFKKELDSIDEKLLKKVYILSEDECQGNVKENGIINKSIIAKYAKDINNSVFFICGPEPMKNCVIKELRELGVKKENIIIEDFFW